LHEGNAGQGGAKFCMAIRRDGIAQLDGVDAATALLRDDGIGFTLAGEEKRCDAGGTIAAISAMVSSAMTPGPLGMAETNPNAAAPWRIAICASAALLMQQILTRGRMV
jgi:hypothetical protein